MTAIVDLPYQVEGAESAQLQDACPRLRATGQVCGMPVEPGARECPRHERWYSLVPAVFGMPYPEDAVSVQEILARAVAMVVRREMNPQQARAVAMLCRELRQNVAACEREVERVWPRGRGMRM